ncbi:Holliday junction resolvase RecU [Fuchsiella alkaliacetigena]|uniref:Holliday junction resolvase RecU n=1 Tax=Fuchsiella alkaliacetigena TaxID=957042 RepID=UPI00200B6FE6|nr:Holliday junction resolvase RecU [Fuchsiella alkaliacetigena]MCK8824715.1 Holliday junction resolvase RecU [Fuchsiella alkaliacetigena]
MSYANRGQALEDMIELTNNQYLRQGRALVQKIETPVKQLSKISRNGTFKACYKKKSTVDYLGIYKGQGIAFDAKQTKVETRFDLKNVKKHQYLYLTSWVANGGIGFLIVHFAIQDEFYYLPFKLLDRYWQAKLKGGRKSIPYDEVAKKKYRIDQGQSGALIDYLSVIEDEVI